MKERPILFSAPMVRALLDGTKTQTRRVVRPRPLEPLEVGEYHPTVVDRHGDESPGKPRFGAYTSDGAHTWRCRYGQPGDRLWVRETWARDDEDGALIYRASREHPDTTDWERECSVGAACWRSPIHMPRSASRILLEVADVRVERLQAITDADAIAEGVESGCVSYQSDYPRVNEAMNRLPASGAVARYSLLWDAINGAGAWDSNPWVWAISFSKVTA